MSHDYTANLSEEEYENEKVNIFSAKEALRKKQEEIEAFQREVNFEKEQLEAHENAVDEQFNDSWASSLVEEIADSLASTYDLSEYPEGTELAVSILVPNEDGTVTEHSVSLDANEEDEECECETEETAKVVYSDDQAVNDFFNDFFESLDEALKAEPEPVKEEPFKVEVSLGGLFPELLGEYEGSPLSGLEGLIDLLNKNQR